MADDEMLNIEVAYALPAHQVLMALRIRAGATVREAVEQSGILESFPDIDLGSNQVGIFGKLIKLEHPLREGDRVEIYRPLIADPKEVRRLRAAKGKKMRKGEAGGDT